MSAVVAIVAGVSAGRSAAWRATQDQDELFEADLRSVLLGSYAARVDAVRAKLGRDLPRARQVRR